jgi:glycosyltransferase involved in cell wall biosynthesis
MQLKKEYFEKIKNNPAIDFRGRVPRDEILNNILPNTDIYLLPTYAEAFGYAVLEAMAYGIPVIATNIFAVPEMIEHEKSGYLINVDQFDCENMYKGYVVNEIPENFKNYITGKLFEYLTQLIDSSSLRKRIGSNGLNVARMKFSFETRNRLMADIYHKNALKSMGAL